jgi:hypothetical protein
VADLGGGLHRGRGVVRRGTPPPEDLPPAPARRYPARFLSPEEASADTRPHVGLSLLTCGLEFPEVEAAAYAAVHSLLASDALQVAAGRIAVLDNGSRGGAWLLRLLEQMGAHVEARPQNVGIAAGRNAIARRLLEESTPAFVLEFHTDHLFPQVWLRPLLDAMAAYPDLGAVGPALVTGQGAFGSPSLAVDYARPVPWLLDDVNAACQAAAALYADEAPRLRRGLSHPVLKRREALEDCGLYDEEAFRGQNFEDTDEARRLEAGGWRVAVCLDAWVFHRYFLTRVLVDDLAARFRANGAAFRRKWGDADLWLAEWERANWGVYRRRTSS